MDASTRDAMESGGHGRRAGEEGMNLAQATVERGFDRLLPEGPGEVGQPLQALPPQ